MKNIKLIDEVKESIYFHQFVIIDTALDTITLLFIIACCWVIEKALNFIGYENPLMKVLINFVHIIIILTLITPMMTKLILKKIYLLNDSKYKIELDTSSKDHEKES